MTKNFDYKLRNGQVVFVSSDENDLLDDEMVLIVKSLLEKKHLYSWTYGTIGIDEENNTLHLLEIDTLVGGDHLWEEHDLGLSFFEYDLKEIRGY